MRPFAFPVRHHTTMPIFTAPPMRWSFLVVVGVLLAALGLWLWLPAAAPAVAEDPMASSTWRTASPERKRQAFEQWVAERFARPVFKVLRGHNDDRGPLSTTISALHDPDMLLAFQTSSEKDLLAVDCMWRPRFDRRTVVVAGADLMEHYRLYAEKNACKVFIALGIGGTPAGPADVYILPVDRIASGTMDMGLLVPFKQRSPGGTFYYYPDDGRLVLFGPPAR